MPTTGLDLIIEKLRSIDTESEEAKESLKNLIDTAEEVRTTELQISGTPEKEQRELTGAKLTSHRELVKNFLLPLQAELIKGLRDLGLTGDALKVTKSATGYRHQVESMGMLDKIQQVLNKFDLGVSTSFFQSRPGEVMSAGFTGYSGVIPDYSYPLGWRMRSNTFTPAYLRQGQDPDLYEPTIPHELTHILDKRILAHDQRAKEIMSPFYPAVERSIPDIDEKSRSILRDFYPEKDLSELEAKPTIQDWIQGRRSPDEVLARNLPLVASGGSADSPELQKILEEAIPKLKKLYPAYFSAMDEFAELDKKARASSIHLKEVIAKGGANWEESVTAETEMSGYIPQNFAESVKLQNRVVEEEQRKQKYARQPQEVYSYRAKTPKEDPDLDIPTSRPISVIQEELKRATSSLYRLKDQRATLNTEKSDASVLKLDSEIDLATQKVKQLTAEFSQAHRAASLLTASTLKAAEETGNVADVTENIVKTVKEPEQTKKPKRVYEQEYSVKELEARRRSLEDQATRSRSTIKDLRADLDVEGIPQETYDNLSKKLTTEEQKLIAIREKIRALIPEIQSAQDILDKYNQEEAILAQLIQPRSKLGPKFNEFIDKYTFENKDTAARDLQLTAQDAIRSGTYSFVLSGDPERDIAQREAMSELMSSSGYGFFNPTYSPPFDQTSLNKPRVFSAAVGKRNADLETMSTEDLLAEQMRLMSLLSKDDKFSLPTPDDKVIAQRIADLKREIETKKDLELRAREERQQQEELKKKPKGRGRPKSVVEQPIQEVVKSEDISIPVADVVNETVNQVVEQSVQEVDQVPVQSKVKGDIQKNLTEKLEKLEARIDKLFNSLDVGEDEEPLPEAKVNKINDQIRKLSEKRDALLSQLAPAEDIPTTTLKPERPAFTLTKKIQNLMEAPFADIPEGKSLTEEQEKIRIKLQEASARLASFLDVPEDVSLIDIADEPPKIIAEMRNLYKEYVRAGKAVEDTVKAQEQITEKLKQVGQEVTTPRPVTEIQTDLARKEKEFEAAEKEYYDTAVARPGLPLVNKKVKGQLGANLVPLSEKQFLKKYPDETSETYAQRKANDVELRKLQANLNKIIGEKDNLTRELETTLASAESPADTTKDTVTQKQKEVTKKVDETAKAQQKVTDALNQDAQEIKERTKKRKEIKPQAAGSGEKPPSEPPPPPTSPPPDEPPDDNEEKKRKEAEARKQNAKAISEENKELKEQDELLKRAKEFSSTEIDPELLRKANNFYYKERESILRAAGGKTDISSFEDFRKLPLESQKEIQEVLSLTDEISKSMEDLQSPKSTGFTMEKMETGWTRFSRVLVDVDENITRVIDSYVKLGRVVTAEEYSQKIVPGLKREEQLKSLGAKAPEDISQIKKLVPSEQTTLLELAKLTDKDKLALEDLGKSAGIILGKIRGDWREVLKATVDNVGAVEQVSVAYVNFKDQKVIPPTEIERTIAPSIEEQMPDMARQFNPEVIAKVDAKLNEVTSSFKLTGEEITKTTTKVNELTDEWLEFDRTISTSQGSYRARAYVEKFRDSDVFSREAFREEQKARAKREQQSRDWSLLEEGEQFRGVMQTAQKGGWQQKDLQKVVEQQPSGVWLIDFERINEATGHLEKLQLATNRFGDNLTRTNRRMLDFSEAVVRNFQELLRWSIGIGILYGGLRRVNELLQLAVDNEAKLADITITLGSAQREVNDIFMDAAVVAKETGESINAVLETYGLAYRAVGGIADPIQRTASANKLLTDATILNKLSSLDAAESIDVLAGSLRQLPKGAGDAADAFDRGRDLLDKWVILSTKANVDLATLATGFSVTAESALNAGMSVEELNAVIATLAEKIGGLGGKETGNAVRALIGGMYQDQAAQILSRYGVAVKDTTGSMRDFMDISQDIFQLYRQGIISEDQLNKIGLTLGGGVRRGQQYVAFLTDLERVEENVAVQGNSTGASQEALGRVMDTVRTANVQLSNSFQYLAQMLGTDGGVLDSVKGLTMLFSELVTLTAKLTDLLNKITVPAALLGVIGLYTKLGGDPAKRRLTSFNESLGYSSGALINSILQRMGLAEQTGTQSFNRYGKEVSPQGTGTFTGIAGKVQAGIGKVGMGTLLGGMAAIPYAAQGGAEGWGKAGLTLGAAAVGTLLAGGNPIGGVIGAAIASALIDSATKDPNRDEFAMLFVPPADLKTRQKKEEETLTESEKQVKDQEQLMSELFAAKDGTEWLGRLVNNISFGVYKGLTPKEKEIYTEPEQYMYAGLMENVKNLPSGERKDELLRILEEIESLKEESKIVIPPKETKFYKLTEQYKEMIPEAEQLMEQRRTDLRGQQRRSEISPKEYRTSLLASFDVPSALPRFLAAANYDLEEFQKALGDAGFSFKDFVDILAKGSAEDITILGELLTEIEDIGLALEELANKGPSDIITFRDQDMPKADLQKMLDDRIRQFADAAAATKEIIKEYDAEIATKRLAPVVDLEGQVKSKTDAEKIFKEAVRMERAKLKLQVELGVISDQDYQDIIDQAQMRKTMLDLGEKIGGYVGQGLIDSGYIQEAFELLAEEGSLAFQNVGYQFFSESLAEIQRAANSPQYTAIRNAIMAQGGRSEETGQVVVSERDPTNPIFMKKDWAIVQYLLGRILATEEKQLEGIYNLPGGSSFYVPFDAYKMGYANDGAGGGGLDIPTVQDNTAATEKATQATLELIAALKDVGVQFSEPGKPPKEGELSHDETVRVLNKAQADYFKQLKQDSVVPSDYGKTEEYRENVGKLMYDAFIDYVTQQKGAGIGGGNDVRENLGLGNDIRTLITEFEQKFLPKYPEYKEVTPKVEPTPTTVPEQVTPKVEPTPTAVPEPVTPKDTWADLQSKYDFKEEESIFDKIGRFFADLLGFLKAPPAETTPSTIRPTTTPTPSRSTPVPELIIPKGLDEYSSVGGSLITLLPGLIRALSGSKTGVGEGGGVEISSESIGSLSAQMGDSVRSAILEAMALSTLTPQGLPGAGGVPNVQGTATKGDQVANPQINIQAAPVKINLTATTNLMVDGRALATVILPYLYAAMIRFEPVAGGSSRRYTYV